MVEAINRILIHYGEIALKGGNRPGFINYLRNNIEQKLDCLGFSWPFGQEHGYLLVTVPAAGLPALPEVLEALAEIPGIVWFAPATYVPAWRIWPETPSPDYDLITENVVAMARRYEPQRETFRVQVKRADKTFPRPSPVLERELGSAVYEGSGWRHVKLENPDRTFHVNIQRQGIFFFDERREGLAGIPVGVAGRVLVMLSGGIDSPVAAVQMARRGCPIDLLHFTATAGQQQVTAEHKMARLAAQISRVSRRSRLVVVPNKYFELATAGRQLPQETVLFRRFVARVAQQLAAELDALALVSGDCVGQVASQTMENLVAVSQAVTLPIMRPLLTLDKRDIMGQAERFGTYAASIEPYKDCCALLTDKPDTQTTHASLSRLEARLFPDMEGMMAHTLADAVALEFLYGTMVAPSPFR